MVSLRLMLTNLTFGWHSFGSFQLHGDGPWTTQPNESNSHIFLKLPVSQTSMVRKLLGSAKVCCRVDNSSGRSLSVTLVGRAVSDTQTVRLHAVVSLMWGRRGKLKKIWYRIQPMSNPPTLPWINKAALLYTHLSFLLLFFARGVFRKCVCTVCQSRVLRWTGLCCAFLTWVGKICFLDEFSDNGRKWSIPNSSQNTMHGFFKIVWFVVKVLLCHNWMLFF